MPDNDFDVQVLSSSVDDDQGIVLTAYGTEALAKKEGKILAAAIDEYNALKRPQIYSVSPNDASSSTELTLDTINTLSVGLNSNLTNLETVNRIILQNVNSDPLMSYAYRTIMAHIPTDYTMSYISSDGDETNDQPEYATIKLLVERFNRDLKLERLIPRIVSTAWLEGNAPVVLRTNGGTGVVDILPLAIMHPSGYSILGDDVMQVEVTTLKNRLQKTYPKSRKTKKEVYFENLTKEVKANFSSEIAAAFAAGDSICRMPVAYADCVKVNSCNRAYGVSPFFCSLRPLTLLKNLEAADANEARARSKYVIFQKLRKELLGTTGQYRGLAEQALAHENLVQAIKTNLSAYTAAPFVESLEFVSAKSTGDDSVKLNTTYTTRFLESLGISWTDIETPNGTMANLSFGNLIKSINGVLVEVERVLNKFYLTILKDNGITNPKFVPTIRIARAESLEMSMRKDLAQFVYATLNGSLTTSYKLLGLDIANEAALRTEEQKKGYADIFLPHATAYTTNGDAVNGRPANTDPNADPDKQAYDADRYKETK